MYSIWRLNVEIIIYYYCFKKEFPATNCTFHAFNYAAENGNNDTIMLLKKEFPEISCMSDVFGYAIKGNHIDTLVLLRKEFPEFNVHPAFLMQRF